MTYEERRVVTDEPGEVEETPIQTEVVRTTPDTVVEEGPVRRIVVSGEDPVGSALAASQLIHTIVWSVVVLVLLFVLLWVLHVYLGLF